MPPTDLLKLSLLASGLKKTVVMPDALEVEDVEVLLFENIDGTLINNISTGIVLERNSCRV